MTKIPYHVFKKPKKTREGKSFFRWYYYFYDKSGKKIQKSCPKCRNRSDAESYIRTLPPLDTPGIENPDLLIKNIAENMYISGSAHVDRRAQLGKTTEIETLAESRRYILNILKIWGDRPLKSIEMDEILKYLFSLKYSGSWKNRYITILREIYAEARWYGCKIPVPDFPAFSRHSKKADIFTAPELKALFVPENFPNNQYFLFFLLTLSAGLRIGETRAVRLKQLIFERKVLIVDGFCKKDGTRTVYNKKGTPDDPKLRIVPLPDFTLVKFIEFIREKPLRPEDFIFTCNDRPVRQETAEMVFVRALVKAGIAYNTDQLKDAGIWQKGHVVKKSEIIPDGRKLVPHSLRYTYVSRMRRELTATQLQPMTGHTTEAMVDYYNRRVLDEVLANLPKTESALNGLLDFNNREGGI